MIDAREQADSMPDLEALIRSAQNFVAVSDDLRPRVLEAAREERNQRRAHQRIGKAAALAIALGIFLTLIREEAGETSASSLSADRSAGASFSRPESLFSQDEAAWELVDSLTELRKRQASLFRLSL
jgi:hypothetical protein